LTGGGSVPCSSALLRLASSADERTQVAQVRPMQWHVPRERWALGLGSDIPVAIRD